MAFCAGGLARDAQLRRSMVETIEAYGADATRSTPGNSNYLVGGKNPGATKRDDADTNDVSIADEDEFRALLAEPGIDLE